MLWILIFLEEYYYSFDPRRLNDKYFDVAHSLLPSKNTHLSEFYVGDGLGPFLSKLFKPIRAEADWLQEYFDGDIMETPLSIYFPNDSIGGG